MIGHKRYGRKKPYTEAGIHRMPCVRCGEPSKQQWQICADGALYRPICPKCDILINQIILQFMRDPYWESKVAAYKKKLLG